MLRLDLKDNDDTVLFVNPMDGVEIGKLDYDPVIYEKNIYKLTIGKLGMCTTHYVYSSKEDRDAAYDYVLAEITTYLFPQVELGPICQNDFAMPEEEQ